MTSPEKRRHGRSYIITSVEYTMVSSAREEVFDGIIANISESGICLLTTNSLTKGQKIIIKNTISPFSRIAVVRWSEKYKHLYYKTGLEFL